MTVKIKIIALTIFAMLISSCVDSQPHPKVLQKQTESFKQLEDNYVKLEERVKALENQLKTLNEDVYRNTKRTENLEEVYNYVAKDNSMPGTGEELPSNALND